MMTERDCDIETMMMTDSERAYDIGNKGYLSKVERQLKQIDDELLESGHPVPDPGSERRGSTTSMIGLPVGNNNNNNNKKKKSFGSSASTHTSPYSIEGDDQDPSYEEFDEEDMDLSMSGRVDLGDDRPHTKNYQEYLNKVQRDFKDYELQHHGQESSSDSSSRPGIFRTRDMVKSTTTRGYRPRCVCPFSTGAVILLTAVTMLLVANFVMSLWVWTELVVLSQHPEFAVDALSGALVSSHGSSAVAVSTMAAGFTLELPVIMPDTSNHHGDDTNVMDRAIAGVGQEDHPFACIGLDHAVDLWTHVKQGVATSVVLVKKDAAEDILRRSEYGVRLTFDGATQNSTHACIPTENQRHTLCIDFVSHRCDAFDNDNDNQVTNDRATNEVAEAQVGDGSIDDDDDDAGDSVETGFLFGGDEIGAQDDNVDEVDDDADAVLETGVSMEEEVGGDPAVRRALFQKLVQDKEQAGNNDKSNKSGLRVGRRAKVESCQYGRWCRNFASIMLIESADDK